MSDYLDRDEAWDTKNPTYILQIQHQNFIKYVTFAR
jgi:hypothetical protein